MPTPIHTPLPTSAPIPTPAPTPTARPNILFILIDDLGARDLGCFGSSFYETPRLDRLAREGMRFTQAYAACPVCSPTRASILSGKYPARVGVTQWIGGRSEGKLKDVPYLHYLPLEETSLATALREEGYQTWHVGKWHLGDRDFYPEHHGFDVNIAGSHKGSPRTYFSPYQIENLEDGPEGEYLTDRLTDDAIDLIRNRGDKPFFLHLSHYAVHTPIMAPEALVEKYRAKAARLRLDQVEALVEGEHFPCIHKSDRRLTRRVLQSDPAYAAMMENLDTNIGRVLDALAEEGVAEHTLVVFTSDNGGLATAEGAPTCNAPLAEGKGWSEEGGTRVCQIARLPGVVPAASACAVPVTSTDFYPTFLELAGAPLRPAQHVDGVSLMPLLRGEAVTAVDKGTDGASGHQVDRKDAAGAASGGGEASAADVAGATGNARAAGIAEGAPTGQSETGSATEAERSAAHGTGRRVGQSVWTRDAIFWHYPHYSNQGGRPAASVVMGDWKLILDFEDDGARLYDLRADISETTNLAEREPARAAMMLARLKAWQAEVEAKIPEPNPGWQAKLKRPQIPNNAHE